MRSVFAPAGVSWLVFLVLVAAAGSLAQNTGSIFVTPIASAPFTGVIDVERTMVQPNGSVISFKTTREVARDSQGRIYNVFRELVPVSGNITPPIIRIHFYDPQTRSYTYLYPQRRTYLTGMVNHPPATGPADLVASPLGNSAPLNQFTRQEDLGTHTVEGVSAHGVRETQTIPAANSGTGNEILLTDEYWYSDELQMNVMVKHNDPRTGSVTMTLTQVTRTDPDPALFQIPAGYRSMNAGRATPQ
jgi:hypothetical protein